MAKDIVSIKATAAVRGRDADTWARARMDRERARQRRSGVAVAVVGCCALVFAAWNILAGVDSRYSVKELVSAYGAELEEGVRLPLRDGGD